MGEQETKECKQLAYCDVRVRYMCGAIFSVWTFFFLFPLYMVQQRKPVPIYILSRVMIDFPHHPPRIDARVLFLRKVAQRLLPVHLGHGVALAGIVCGADLLGLGAPCRRCSRG